jgi:CrcB protein
MSIPEPGDHSRQRASDVDPDLQPADPGPRWREPHLSSLVAAVAIGGVAGAEARYGLQAALPHDSAQWPWATLLINISGCLLIGVLMVVVTELVDAHPLIRPLLGVGVLGGYTTFSTYTVDVITLVQAGRWPLAVGYLLATPVFAVLAAAAGAAITRMIAARRGRYADPIGPDPPRTFRPPSGAATADLRQHPAGEVTQDGGQP